MAPVTGAYTALVDGYNVIQPHPVLGELPLEEARRRLMTMLGGMRWPFPVGRCIVVFDGPENSRTGQSSTIQMQFAYPSADDYICQTLRHADRPDRYIVISNDREILTTAKAYRSKHFSPEWLLARCSDAATRPQRLKSNPDASPKKTLPPKDARRIDEELRRLWLKDSNA